jgi:hypothetical protein
MPTVCNSNLDLVTIQSSVPLADGRIRCIYTQKTFEINLRPGRTRYRLNQHTYIVTKINSTNDDLSNSPQPWCLCFTPIIVIGACFHPVSWQVLHVVHCLHGFLARRWTTVEWVQKSGREWLPINHDEERLYYDQIHQAILIDSASTC